MQIFRNDIITYHFDPIYGSFKIVVLKEPQPMELLWRANLQEKN